MKAHQPAIRNFVVDNFLFGEAGDLDDRASLLGQGVIDSAGVLELVAHLESTYGIKVGDKELVPENLDSVVAIASYLERRLAETNAPT
jgi:acyl carrier protein